MLEKHGAEAELFIFDMMFWELLKRGRPSEESGSGVKAVIRKIGPSGSAYGSVKLKCTVVNDVIDFELCFIEDWLKNLSSFSPNNVRYLSFSGLSPPLL